MKSKVEEWNAVLSISDNMLLLAGQGQWSDLAELEADRFVRIQNLFNNTVEFADNDIVKDGICHLLENDRAIKKLCESKQKTVLTKLTALDTGKKVKEAYLQNSD